MFSNLKNAFNSIKSTLPWAKRKVKSVYDDPNTKKWVMDSMKSCVKTELLRHSLKLAIECNKDYPLIVVVCYMILMGINLYAYYTYALIPIK